MTIRYKCKRCGEVFKERVFESELGTEGVMPELECPRCKWTEIEVWDGVPHG